jgi:hypothetical protein
MFTADGEESAVNLRAVQLSWDAMESAIFLVLPLLEA